MNRAPGKSIRIGVAALYAVLLAYLLLTPVPLWFLGQSGLQNAIDSTLSDLLQHFLAYGVLGSLFFWAAARPGTAQIGRSFGLAMLHGTLAECLQLFVPERFFAWPDLAANVLGAACGTGAAFALSLAVRRRIGCG
jgi:VanZ family protein